MTSGRRLPSRFYGAVAVERGDAGWQVLLDGRQVRTPLKAPLAMPTAAMAEASAAEWRDQAETIDPALMPVTRLANTAIDRVVGDHRARIVEEVVAYAGSDLVCYRAEAPESLVRRQAAAWDPVLAWAATHADAAFAVTAGVLHIAQPEEALAAIRLHADRFDPFALTGIHNMMTLTGSALMALMTAAGGLAPGATWAAAHVEEDWQAEQWGVDAEAAARRRAREAEFMAAARFVGLARL